jgi:transcription initiation factor TFIIIB Brf1 subunit/transcription initiation factor TFIIB
MDLIDMALESMETIKKNMATYVDLINKENEDAIKQGKGKVMQKCESCSSTNITIKRNEMFCDDCGSMSKIIIEDIQSFGYETTFTVRRYNTCSKEQALLFKEKALEHRFNELPLVLDEEIIKHAVNCVMAIQKKEHRKSAKFNAIQAAALYLSYLSHGKAQSQKLLCKIFGLTSIAFNEGYKIVMNAVNNNVVTDLDIPDKTKYMLYIKFYLETFGLDFKYYKFGCDVVQFCLEKGIGHKSLLITKCCGIVFFIIEEFKHEKRVSKDELSIFEVNSQTYRKFYNLIKNEVTTNDELRKIFAEHQLLLDKWTKLT